MGESKNDWGRVETFEGRGVWVPNGITAEEIAKAAEAVEDRFAIDKHIARSIAITVLQAVRAD